MIFRLQLTYSEIEYILDVKYIDTKAVGYTLPPGIYEISEINLMVKCWLPDEVKIDITTDDIRLNSKLTLNKLLRFIKKWFFYTNLGFTQSHSGPPGYIEGFVQIKPDTYKSDKPINIFGIDKIQLKCDCIDGSILDGVRQPILNSFALSSPPGRKKL